MNFQSFVFTVYYPTDVNVIATLCVILWYLLAIPIIRYGFSNDIPDETAAVFAWSVSPILLPFMLLSKILYKRGR